MYNNKLSKIKQLDITRVCVLDIASHPGRDGGREGGGQALRSVAEGSQCSCSKENPGYIWGPSSSQEGALMLDVVPGQGGSPILGGSPVSTAWGCEQPHAPFQCDPEESRSMGQPWASCPPGSLLAKGVRVLTVQSLLVLSLVFLCLPAFCLFAFH